MKKLVLRLLPVLDFLLVPFLFVAAWLLKAVRIGGLHNLPWSRRVLLGVGVFPIRRHYYEPAFDFRGAPVDDGQERALPGIDWNEAGQLGLLAQLTYAGELEGIPGERPTPLDFYFNNGNFESGDAEFWYQLVRAVRPRHIIEVGSGYSTLMALKAVRRNREADPGYQCEHICIEPYEMPWLEASGVKVLRKRVEEVELAFFGQLEANDILFIDSSHVITPYGDVLFEYLQLLPTLKKGVIVHVHDIFSPRNYPKEWLRDRVLFWNEQYLLEAFLAHNRSWRVLAGLNFLHHRHPAEMKRVAPYLSPEREPGSFYLQKVD